MKKADKELLRETINTLSATLGDTPEVLNLRTILDNVEAQEKKHNERMVKYITNKRKENPKYCR